MSVNYNGYNNNSASKLLESVLEDMNNIIKANDHSGNSENICPLTTKYVDYTDFSNGNNNCSEISHDQKFELMVSELQNCLQEAVDVRSMMRNLSSDKKEFLKALLKTDLENNINISHKVDLMDEISKLKLDIAYLQRDKQGLLNQINDLNSKVQLLNDENVRLRKEMNLMKVDEMDYCFPPNELGDNCSIGESHQSKDSALSGALRNESPLATSTPEKPKSATKVPVVPPHRIQINQRQLPHDFLNKISPPGHIRESTGKSNSWSELRTNQVIHDDQVPMMTPPSQRKSSMNFITNRISSDSKKKTKLFSNKSLGLLPCEYDANFDLSICSQPVSSNINALALLAVTDKLAAENSNSQFNRNNPLRMTAGPRLLAGGNKLKPTEVAVQRVLSLSNPNLQSITLLPSKSDFKLWSKDHVCAFLHQIGLGAYANNCRKWLTNGLQFIEASKKEIEKELNITNKLHLKKLLIHIRQLTSVHVTAATYFCLTRPKLKIAANFTTRLWLDDIGLLHYMSLFASNCIDGYMLDQITLEDLQHLKLTNELHVLSLKRGIQLLREIDYDLSLLIRRPAENTFNTQSETGSNTNLEVTCNVHPGEVCRWTQHQVMEWLRRIELPEYASNIRGSGIHGALIILEDRFNANSLASVLNIPQNRSLLRRHLQTKFQELIGTKIVAQKKRALENSDFSPVTITSKMKYHRKKSFFNVIKRKTSNETSEELLVPYTYKIEDLDLKLNQETSSVDNNNAESSSTSNLPQTNL